MGYSWGDDTGSKGKGGFRSTRGYDYKDARKAYKEPSESGRSKTDEERPERPERSRRVGVYSSRRGKTEPPIDKTIATESTHPIVIAVDVTGSMAEWPGIIFEKLPLLGKEVARYAPSYAISFTAFGDARCDRYPLQVRDFDADEALDEHVKSLYPEGGGGDAPESHGLVAYYYLNHCQIPKAVKPIFVFVTDVLPHSDITKSEVKEYIGDKLQSEISSSKTIKELAAKFSTWVILRGYDDAGAASAWKKILEPQRVLPFEEPRDVVEVLIGIIAGEVGKIEDFELRSAKRHSDRPDRIERVSRSLRSVKEKAAGGSKAGDAVRSDRTSSKSVKSKKLA